MFFFPGGHSEYLEKSITEFNIRQSVFDSVVITIIKVLALWSLYTWLEDVTMYTFETPYNPSLKRKKNLTHVAILFLSTVCLVYFVTKGSLILDDYLNNPSYEPMHVTYTVTCISTVVFAVIEMFLSVLSFMAMRRLAVWRILHRYNEDGDEVDDKGVVIPKKATLRRVIALAKPVRIFVLLETLI